MALEYEATPAPSAAIWVQGPAADVARPTLNPVSFVELSVHVRLIWLGDTAVAVRPLGVTGAARFVEATRPEASA